MPMDPTVEIDPEGLGRRFAQYQEWLRVNHYSEETILERGKYLDYFARWCGERGLTQPGEITRPILERYQGSLFHHRKRDGKPLSLSSQWSRLQALRGFFRWLVRQNLLLHNPAGDLRLPRMVRQLPKEVLSASEAERVLSVPDISTPLGLRDRSLLETLYSTGMRRREVVGLLLYDVDWDAGTLRVRQGKGGRQRVIPIGERALKWLRRYVEEVRPTWVVPPDEGAVFLSKQGRALSLVRLTEEVGTYVERSGIGKRGSVHLFRHTMATLMLEGGADVRYVQSMLGHVRLETTVIYTHVAVAKLKEIHRATHPAERRARSVAKAPQSSRGALEGLRSAAGTGSVGALVDSEKGV